MVTVFTPTYNRAYIISKLYESLCRQTSKGFEWLIVDDGSTDNTESLIKSYILENKITIRYFRQKNGGKHRAINKGVEYANGELFFIVDSDDKVTEEAVEWINGTALPIMEDDSFAGLSGIRIYPDGTKIGGGADFGTVDTDTFDLRYRRKIKGDLAEVFKTDILRKYPFPEFENERFCPEALVWNRIAKRYKLRYVHKGIYICEYLQDGLTSKITKIRRNSPKASVTYYSELYHSNIPFLQKVKAAINFHRFAPRLFASGYNMLNILSLLSVLPGKLLRFRDR